MRGTKKPIYLFSKTPHADAIHVPIIKTFFLQPDIDFSRYDAIVLTSKQAVTALEKISPEWKSIPVLAVASKTADAVKEAGGRLIDIGDGYGDTLGQLIINNYASYRWLYPRPKVVASDFKAMVKQAGVELDDTIVYETLCNPACQNIALSDNAVLVFTSPSTIACFLEFYAFKASHKVVVIGKTTARALPEKVTFVMPDEPTVDASVSLAQSL